MFRQRRLADAEFLRDEEGANPIGNQIAVQLLPEMGARILEPLQDQESAVVSQRLQGIHYRHIAKLLNNDTVPQSLEGAVVMDKVADRYDIETDVMFPLGAHIDVAATAAAVQPWWNRTLTEVNDAVVRLAVMEGDFHWHKHDAEDEFFYVIEGHLDIELEDRTVALEPGQGVTIPRGVMHFPHARGRTVVLMVEKTGVVPRGD